MSEAIEQVVRRAIDAVAVLAALGEQVEDEWTYVTDLARAQRRRLTEVAERRGGTSIAPDRVRAIDVAIGEVALIADPHRAIDWLSTFPDLVALALDEPLGGA